jgi:hypothetical protein
VLHNRLTDEHPVKRVFMENRKPTQGESRFFVQPKRIYPMLLSLCGNKLCGRLRKR